MNEAGDQGRSVVSVRLLVGSAAIGLGALWLALATPLLEMTSELLIEEIDSARSGQLNVDSSPLMSALSGFIPLVLIALGVSLSTRSLVQPLDGQAAKVSGTLLGILAGLVAWMGSVVAIVACFRAKAAYSSLADSGKHGIDPKALTQGLRMASDILSVFPWPCLVMSVVLAGAAFLGFSDRSSNSTRRGKNVVVFSFVVTLLIVGLFSLHLHDTLKVEEFVTSSSSTVDPSVLMKHVGRSLYAALAGYGLLAFNGVLMSLAAFLGRRQQYARSGEANHEQPQEGHETA